MKRAHLSSKNFCHTNSPCAGIETFQPERLGYVVDMVDLATFGVNAEDVYGLIKFPGLKYNSLKDLKERLVCLKLWGVASTFALPSTSMIAK